MGMPESCNDKNCRGKEPVESDVIEISSDEEAGYVCVTGLPVGK
jgi:hypothetical protein